MAYVILAFAILFEVVGTISLRLSDGFTKIAPVSVTVIGYGISFYLMSLTLKSLSVGYTYAVWSALGMVLITLAGLILFHEKMDIPGAVGMAMIVAGVFILSVYSKMSAH
ncbi:MAG: multidrug efflux SMR transporter [Parvularculaceae bacterium]